MLTRRILEIATAVLTGAFGVVILVGSIRMGVGWTPRGMGTGSFPCLAGGLVVAGSLYNLVRGALGPRTAVMDRPGARKLALAFVPAVAFVAAIPLLGMHLAAAIYVFGAIAAQGKMPIPRALAIGIATAIALYATFDWAFSVALPRGLLGAALGF